MFKSHLLRKSAYGLDTSGEVGEVGDGANGTQENVEDTAQPVDHTESPEAPQNNLRDTQALEEFPQLQGRRSPKIIRQRN